MQRQSLGSPVSKLHSHGGAVKDDTLISDDPKRKDLHSLLLAEYDDDDDDHRKSAKPRRFSTSSSSSSSSISLSSASKPEKLIHFIPILTFLCFLVLYLVSHDPSQSDLVHFDGFKRSSNHIDSAQVNGFNELRRSDVMAIRSLKNLRREFGDKRDFAKSRTHRKLADF